MPGIASVTVIFSVCGTYPRYVPPRATVKDLAYKLLEELTTYTSMTRQLVPDNIIYLVAARKEPPFSSLISFVRFTACTSIDKTPLSDCPFLQIPNIAR